MTNVDEASRGLSPGKPVRPLLVAAVVIVALYSIANVFGLRAGMTLLSGTFPVPDANLSTLMCGVYLALYLGATIVAPILLIAAAIELLARLMCDKMALATRTECCVEDVE